MGQKDKIDNLNILLVEDSETDAYSIKRCLNKYMEHPCFVRHVGCMADAETILLESHDIDLVLLDLGLPDTAGKDDTYKRVDDVKGTVPVIVLTSVHDHELAVDIVDRGAEDYVRKSSIGADPEILCSAIDFAVCRSRNIEELKKQAEKEIQEKDQVIGWMTGSYSVDPHKP